MKDPATLAVAAGVGVATASMGHVLGFPVDAVVFGLLGGIAGVVVLPPVVAAKGALGRMLALVGYVMAAVLAGAALGPLTAALTHADSVDPLIELRAYSFLWGAGLQLLLPTAINALQNRIRQAGGLPAAEGKQP